MPDDARFPPPRNRRAPIEMDPEEFRRVGYAAVDRVAELLSRIRQVPVTTGESPSEIRALLPRGPVPERGAGAQELVDEAARLLAEHSLWIGHPRFLGFITSSAAPIGALGDLLAAGANPNLGGFVLSPIATEIEAQTVRWIAELIGYPVPCGGLLVSGGNMANFVGFLAARRAAATGDIRTKGLAAEPRFGVYVSEETHTWIQKAADLFGFGTDAIRWIETDSQRRMKGDELERRIAADRKAGVRPLVVVGTAGSVSVGAIDPLPKIAEICRRHGVWFHVDGAYGAPAAMLPEAPEDLKGLSLADSVAVDPHKWLYSPLEAGCAIVRDRQLLEETFRYRPAYYHLQRRDEEEPINFHELGMQNSRGFRALKVWLGIRQVGRQGYIRMIRDDIALARALFDRVSRHAEMEAGSCHLSVATFRFVPRDLAHDPKREEYLNELNEEVLEELQAGGETFFSNAVVDGKFLLRGCVVNFRTSLEDIEALPEIVARVGRQVHADKRRAAGRG
jgi:glutamate/tyrosine decarboxylase-like PLP-dependent enzyme